MKPDSPGHPDPECRVTALILGELSPEEASRLRAEMEQNPALKQLHDRIIATVQWVREMAALPAGGNTEPEPKLSPERRERLLARLKTRTLPIPTRRASALPWADWAVPLAAAAALMLTLSWLLFLPLARSKVAYDRYALPAVAPLVNTLGEAKGVEESLTVVPPPPASLGDTPTLGKLFVASGDLPATVPTARGEAAAPAANAEMLARYGLRPGSERTLTAAPGNAPAATAAAGRVQQQIERASKPMGGQGVTEPAARPARGVELDLAKARSSAPEPEIRRRFAAGVAGKKLAEMSDEMAKTEGLAFSDLDSDGYSNLAGAAAALPSSAENFAYFRQSALGVTNAAREEAANSISLGRAVRDWPELPAGLAVNGAQPARELERFGGVAAVSSGMAGVTSPSLAESQATDRGRVETASGLGGGSGGFAGGGFVAAEKDKADLFAKYHDSAPRTLAESAAEAAGLPQLEIVEVKPVEARQVLSELKAADQEALSERETVTLAKEPAAPAMAPPPAAPVPQPELATRDNAFSTFSLNVSDVSFKLAAASLENGTLPEPASIRSEEFLNALNYRDPEPPPGLPLAFNWERSRWPFAHNRDLLRLSVKTAAAGRAADRPLNLVLLLDNSGSMERADRVATVQAALRVLAGKLQPHDRFSLITFARTPRIWFDGISGDQAAARMDETGPFAPEGGTNLEEALNQAYATANRHFLPNGNNRVVLLTDGAANLGNIDPAALQANAVRNRQQGIALDCFGVGWEGYNDDLLEVLSRNADGRYGFLNRSEEAGSEFAAQLAGALQVFASDVKVQVQFNPDRVKAYRQIGYAKHQLTKEQFRDNSVDAAEIGAAEAGVAAYVIEVDPAGQGPLGTVRVRYRDVLANLYQEQEWLVPYTGAAPALPDASPAQKLAATAIGFSEWLAGSPYASEISPQKLLALLQGVPQTFGLDPRPQQLEAIIRQAGSLSGQ